MNLLGREYYGPWRGVDVCARCTTRLSERQILYSNATCPYCGGRSGGTVTRTRKIAVRKVYRRWLGIVPIAVREEVRDEVAALVSCLLDRQADYLIKKKAARSSAKIIGEGEVA